MKKAVSWPHFGQVARRSYTRLTFHGLRCALPENLVFDRVIENSLSFYLVQYRMEVGTGVADEEHLVHGLLHEEERVAERTEDHEAKTATSNYKKWFSFK